MSAQSYILGHRHVYAPANPGDTRTAVAEIMGRGWHSKEGRQANFGIKLIPSGTYYPLPQYLFIADIKRDIATILDNIQKDMTP